MNHVRLDGDGRHRFGVRLSIGLRTRETYSVSGPDSARRRARPAGPQMFVPDAEQGVRGGHRLPARSTERSWITPHGLKRHAGRAAASMYVQASPPATVGVPWAERQRAA